jgi:hypothetical protein
MGAFFTFAADSPVLTFCLFYMATRTMFLFYNRTLRTINVAINGWPPEHLDADGDWKPEPEKEETP